MTEKIKCTVCKKFPDEFLELDCFHNICLNCCKKRVNKDKKNIKCFVCKKETNLDDSLFKKISKIKIDSSKKLKKVNTLNDKKLLKAFSFNSINNKKWKKGRLDSNNKLGSNLNIINENSKIENKNSHNFYKSNISDSQKINNTMNNLIGNINDESVSKNILNSNIMIENEILTNNNDDYSKNIQTIKSEEEEENNMNEIYSKEIHKNINFQKNEINKLILIENEIKKSKYIKSYQNKRYFDEIINKIKIYENRFEKEIKEYFDESSNKLSNWIINLKRKLRENELFIEKLSLNNKIDFSKEYRKLVSNHDEQLINNFENSFNLELESKMNELKDLTMKFDDLLNIENYINETEVKMDDFNLKLNLDKIKKINNINEKDFNENLDLNPLSNMTSRLLKKQSNYKSMDKYKKMYFSNNSKFNGMANSNLLIKHLDMSKTVNIFNKNNNQFKLIKNKFLFN